jgi:hypothetical protein
METLLGSLIKWYDDEIIYQPNLSLSKSLDIDSYIVLLQWLLPKSRVSMLNRTYDLFKANGSEKLTYNLVGLLIHKLLNVDDLNNIYDVFVSSNIPMICDMAFLIRSLYDADYAVWWMTHLVEVHDLTLVLAITHPTMRSKLLDAIEGRNINYALSDHNSNSYQILYIIQNNSPQLGLELIEFYYDNRHRLKFINLDNINRINLYNDPWLLNWIYCHADEIKFDYTSSIMDNASSRCQIKILDWLLSKKDTIDLKYTCQSMDCIFVVNIESLNWWLEHSDVLELKYTSTSINSLHHDDSYNHLLWWLEHHDVIELHYTSSAMDYIVDTDMLDLWFDFRHKVELKYTSLAFHCQASIPIMRWWIDHSSELELKIDIISLKYMYNKYSQTPDDPIKIFLTKHSHILGLVIE